MENKKFYIKIEKSENDIVRGVASAEVVDKDGQIIDIDSLDLAYFEKNAESRVTFEHMKKYVCGKVVKSEVVTDEKIKKWIVDIEFLASKMGRAISHLVKNGVVDMLSIGAYISQKSDIVKEGIYERIRNAKPYEVTVTIAGANQEAYILQKSELLKSEFAPEFQEIFDNFVEKSNDEKLNELYREIEEFKMKNKLLDEKVKNLEKARKEKEDKELARQALKIFKQKIIGGSNG